ncbi:proline--tRNA ligase [Sporolactobacillus terrae]|uniref:Proline--tRNA ligase n=1 Tax=Sporolactobacillus terrae TaxID=269673 RepID=A0ABX5Q6V4_9BACL|nr:proline--tRNA ligase [Sporolactobacillus terrae]QAA22375.1 proline--tRNA ligase [Sporolactobacillus terrae]QAA25351.1 proline--tRNA ligase [Sporolactobacillus terrae]UAK17160.1 proline--tRNA ligase [Sporolactobacillus terrae]
MKQSQMFIPTMKETPADAESASHRLLLRGGYIRQNASGVYSYLPLGYKIIKKIEAIIREEMDRTGSQELLMPAMQPAELWHETGRWDVYGPELMRLKDRHNRFFALGATGEELITSLVRDYLNTYKKLPMSLYQIQTKFRDEKRPRFGLLRGREFIMKDAYTFHDSAESLDQTYWVMYHAYCRIFERCGLTFRAVLADSGAIGGKDTHEFQALAEIGEDTIAYSDTSDYAANLEMASVLDQEEGKDGETLPLEKVEGKQEVDGNQAITAYWFQTRSERVVVFLKASDEINDVKVKNLLGTDLIELITGSSEDAMHPAEGVRVFADNGLKHVARAAYYNQAENSTYFHLDPSRDLPIESFDDLRFIKEGDPSPDGSGVIKFARGIEIGQVFKLGTKYSEAMNATYLDTDGKAKPLIMGCYGIGISRTLSAVCEQYHDDEGMIWPKSLAPFTIHLITVNPKKEDQLALSEQLYSQFIQEGYDVLWDDRKERPGVKFAESELIGCPVQVIVGKRASEQIVELAARKDTERVETSTAQLSDAVKQLLNTLA